MTSIPIVIGTFGSQQKIIKGTGGPEIRVETVQTSTFFRTALLRTEKSPSDLRRLAVTQTPVKNQQLTLM